MVQISEIKISPKFRSQTVKAVLSIALFAISYLLILAAAIALTLLCIYGGGMLIGNSPRFITIVIGLGLAGLGIMVLIFVLKFMFKTNKADRSHLVEITRKDEPELFKMIEELVKQIGTGFPKKVYLSNDVNAAVFYDSNFWSMFLPVRKNLQIGIGLVNTVSKSEFKAILSHEFGHFSQKTMKLGSLVYNVNKVIYDMLYDNESFEKLINQWANVSGYFSIFAILTIRIVTGIRWILRKLYDIVNLTYMGLSREMEFHADEIAASVTGHQPIKNSLLRMPLADFAFNHVINFYSSKIADNIQSDNIYRDQAFVMNFIAVDDKLPIVNGLPLVSIEEFGRFNKSRLVIKDQWASHPDTSERIERIEKVSSPETDTEDEIAINIFRDPDKIQKLMTERMFKDVKYEGVPVIMQPNVFKAEFIHDYNGNRFSKLYNGYYDVKSPAEFNPDDTVSIENKTSAEELFSDKMVDLVYSSNALLNDIEVLKQIVNKSVAVKTFDYDGRKYKQSQCAGLIPELKRELEKMDVEIKRNDITIFGWFNELESRNGSSGELKNLYKMLFEYDREFESRYELYTKLSNGITFIHHTTPVEQIRMNFLGLEPVEAKLKVNIKEMLEDNRFADLITKEIRDNLELYISKTWQYFGNEKYFDSNLEMLFMALQNYSYLLSRSYFLAKKRLLDYQESLLNNY